MIKPRFPLQTCALILALSTSAAAQTDSIVVKFGGQVSTLPGDMVTVPLLVDMSGSGGELLGSYTARVTWDASMLFYSDVSPGTFAIPTIRTDSTFSGVLWLTGVSAQGADGLLKLADIEFGTSIAATQSTLTIEITEMSAASTLTDLLPIVVTRDGQFCAGVGRWGDVTGESFANSRDALVILSDLVGIAVDPSFTVANGDVDGDGVVNSRDALILLSYAVGIDIPGQRVLVVIPGAACAASGPPGISVLPDTVDLVPGQAVQMVAEQTDGSGDVTAIPGLNWDTDDRDIALVDADGYVVAVSPGSTTVKAAIGPGITIEAPVIVRAQRFHWYVDAPAVSFAPIQLGTQKLPFATPEFAFPLVSEGDTIHIAPGVHDYMGLFTEIEAGVTVVGDTLTDGTRPVLRAAEADFATAFDWSGGDKGEVRDLIIRGFNVGIHPDGVRNLFVDNVTYEDPAGLFGRAILTAQSLDTLSILNSEFVGDSAHDSFDAIHIADGAGLVQLDGVLVSSWGGEGVDARNVDSLHIDNSRFEWMVFEGVQAFTTDGTITNATVLNSRFVNNSSEDLQISSAGNVWIQNTYIEHPFGDDVIAIHGDTPTISGTSVTMKSDSILAAITDDWLRISEIDSVMFDSLYYSTTDSTVLEYGQIVGNYLEIKNSEFVELWNNPLFGIVAELYVDSSRFVGAGVTTRRADALSISAPASGPRITVMNSEFRNLDHAIVSTPFGTDAGPHVVSGNNIDDVLTAIELRGDSIAIVGNILDSIRIEAIDLQTANGDTIGVDPANVSDNSVTCIAGQTVAGIRQENAAATISNNTITDCYRGVWLSDFSGGLEDVAVLDNTITVPLNNTGWEGIYVDGPWQPTILRNEVLGGDEGILFTPSRGGIVAVIDSNAVSGANSGLYISSGDSITVTGRKNNFSSNSLYGIYNSGPGMRAFNLGIIEDNSSYGVRNLSADSTDATQNWWGDAGGPGVNLANDVLGAVQTDAFLTSTPGDVPPILPVSPSPPPFPSIAVRSDLQRGDEPDAEVLEQETVDRGPTAEDAEEDRRIRAVIRRIRESRAKRPDLIRP